MAAKVPTPEEVIALVGDGGMQQLIAQAQAQQAQAVVDAHHALVEHAAAAGVSVAAMTDADVHMVAAAAAAAAAAGDSVAMLSKVESSAMDFMPLSSAAVVLGSSAAVDSITTDAGTMPMSIDASGSGSSSTVASAGAAAPAASAVIKRKSIPLSMKKEAIEWIMGPGKGVPSRAEKHFSALNWDVSASSFRKWWKNREKILSDASHKKRITGGGRKPYLELSEEKLLVVVIQERAKKDRVTRKWIAKTAQHMFQRTNASFKASENWVTKFIRRNGLTLKRSYVTYEQQQQHAGLAHVSSTGAVDVGDDVAGAGGGDGHSGNGTCADDEEHHQHQHQQIQREHQHIEIDVDDDGSGEHDVDAADVEAREHVVDDEQRKTVVV